MGPRSGGRLLLRGMGRQAFAGSSGSASVNVALGLGGGGATAQGLQVGVVGPLAEGLVGRFTGVAVAAQGEQVADLAAFFFSSRRRHTRCLSDWSSDVCSSD